MSQLENDMAKDTERLTRTTHVELQFALLDGSLISIDDAKPFLCTLCYDGKSDQLLAQDNNGSHLNWYKLRSELAQLMTDRLAVADSPLSSRTTTATHKPNTSLKWWQVKICP